MSWASSCIVALVLLQFGDMRCKKVCGVVKQALKLSKAKSPQAGVQGSGGVNALCESPAVLVTMKQRADNALNNGYVSAEDLQPAL